MSAQPSFDFEIASLPVSRARSGDPSTSADASYANPEIRSKQRLEVLKALSRVEGATDYQLSVMLGIQRTSSGKRRHELMVAGYVTDSGLKAKTDTGSSAIVWCLTELGRKVVGEL